jgi:hypothetical protein
MSANNSRANHSAQCRLASRDVPMRGGDESAAVSIQRCMFMTPENIALPAAGVIGSGVATIHGVLTFTVWPDPAGWATFDDPRKAGPAAR